MRSASLILLVVACGLLAAAPADAGGYYGRGGYGAGVFIGGHRPIGPAFHGAPGFRRGFYGPGFRRYQPWGFGPRWYGPARYGWRGGFHHPGYRYDDRGRYAAGGLLLGLALGGAFADPGPAVVTRRTVYDPAQRFAPPPRVVGTAPEVASELPALGYRRTRDGGCLFLEDSGDGRTFATEVPVEECDGAGAR